MPPPRLSFLIRASSSAILTARRPFSRRAVLGSSSIHAIRRHAPAGRSAKHPPLRIMASIATPRPTTSRTRRKTGRGGMACGLSLITPVSSFPVAPLPRVARHNRRRPIRGWHMLRAVFPSSSHPPRLIVSSATRPAVPIRAGGQGIVSSRSRSDTRGGHLIISSSHHLIIRPVSSYHPG